MYADTGTNKEVPELRIKSLNVTNGSNDVIRQYR